MNLKPIKTFLRDFTLPINAIGTLVGSILMLIGVLGVFYDDKSWIADNAFFDSLGNFDFWCLIAGGILVILSGFYLYDHLTSRNEFLELTDTSSKSKLIRNFEEIEGLAYKLGSSYLVKWKEIKVKHRIRK